jgi:hypothetical protein
LFQKNPSFRIACDLFLFSSHILFYTLLAFNLGTALGTHKTELLALHNVYRSVLFNSTDIPCTGSGLKILLLRML